MLSIYFRWSQENHRDESLEMLREWMVDETEYRVRAQESREGLTSFNQKKPYENKTQRSYTPRCRETKEVDLRIAVPVFVAKRLVIACGIASNLRKIGVWISDGNWPKINNYVFVASLVIIMAKIAIARKNVGLMAVRILITSYFTDRSI